MVIRMVNHAEEVMDAELGQSGIEKLVPERGWPRNSTGSYVRNLGTNISVAFYFKSNVSDVGIQSNERLKSNEFRFSFGDYSE